MKTCIQVTHFPGESGWFKTENDSIPEGEVMMREYGHGGGGGGYVWDGTTTINLSQKPATDSRRRKKHNIGMLQTSVGKFVY